MFWFNMVPRLRTLTWLLQDAGDEATGKQKKPPGCEGLPARNLTAVGISGDWSTKKRGHCFRSSRTQTQSFFSSRIYKSSKPLAKTGNASKGKFCYQVAVEFLVPLTEFYSHSGSYLSFVKTSASWFPTSKNWAMPMSNASVNTFA